MIVVPTCFKASVFSVQFPIYVFEQNEMIMFATETPRSQSLVLHEFLCVLYVYAAKRNR